MRSFEEIKADINSALSINDMTALSRLADEMRALKTSEAEAAALLAFGIVNSYSGNYTSALELFHRSLAISQERDDRLAAALVTLNMGIVYFQTGDYALALECYHRVQAVHEELGNRQVAAHVSNNMGNVFSSTGDYPTALEHFRRALAVSEELGRRLDAANTIGSIGIVYKNTGDHTSALEHFRRALAVYQELADRAGEARSIGNMGNVYHNIGDYSAALEHYQQALALLDELGDRANVALFTGNMIGTLIDIGQYENATDLLDRQSRMHMDNPAVRAAHSGNRAKIAEHMEDLDDARDHLVEALAIATETGLRSFAAETHKSLRDLAQKRNDFAGYIEHNNEFNRISEEIRGKDATQKMAMMEAERRLAAERREREKERALLYGALPKSVADRMIRGEDVTGDYFDQAAVLFFDVAGFTANTSDMPPTDVVKMLETIFRTIDGVCDAHSVIKVKTIGDSYMCFRGDADIATNATSVAHVALEVLQQEFTWPHGDPLRFRAGIHLGGATAGVIGTQRLQYDVWGDTVNIASRMESQGEPGRIQVSEAFASALRLVPGASSESHGTSLEPGTWNLELRGDVEIKGKGMMTTFWLMPGVD